MKVNHPKYRKTGACLIFMALVALSFSAMAPSPSGEKSAARDAFPKLSPPKTPVRALQIMDLDCGSWQEVDARLDEFRAAGVKAIILRVFHNENDGFYRFVKPRYKRGVYFKTRYAPVVADVLGPMCELAHSKGIMVLAWMTTRYANYGMEGDEHLRCMAWSFEKKGPELRRGYSPLLPEAQDRMAAIWSDMAKYPIDGVLIQDDLILKHTEGMNLKARQLYKKATGKDADPDKFYGKVRKEGGRWLVGEYTKDFERWARWKNSQLLLLAERLRRTVQQKRPNRPVGMNLFYETATSPVNALRWYSQDMDATISSDLDFYAFMFYHRQMADELRIPREDAVELIDEALTDLVGKVDHPQRIWVKVQSVDWDTGTRIPHAEMAEVMGVARRHGPLGLVVIPAKRSLNLTSLEEIYR